MKKKLKKPDFSQHASFPPTVFHTKTTTQCLLFGIGPVEHILTKYFW